LVAIVEKNDDMSGKDGGHNESQQRGSECYDGCLVSQEMLEAKVEAYQKSEAGQQGV
jgi:hypothetical protein